MQMKDPFHVPPPVLENMVRIDDQMWQHKMKAVIGHSQSCLEDSAIITMCVCLMERQI